MWFRIFSMASQVLISLETWYLKMVKYWWPTPVLPAQWTAACLVDEAYQFTEQMFPYTTDIVVQEVALDCVLFSQLDPEHITVYRREKKDFVPLSFSKMRFLAITYHHPDLGSVAMHVDRAMMLVGNEILSPAFVRRALPQRSIPFDDRYWIECIDDRIQHFKFGPGEHLVLTEEGCTVVE
jgi:hypothetical protein